MVAAAGVGAIIGRTRPGNRLAWWFSLGGAMGAAGVLGDLWTTSTVRPGPGLQLGPSVGLLLSTIGLYGTWALLAALVPLGFPDGELRTRPRRVAAWAAAIGGVCCCIGAASPDVLRDNPFNAAGAENALALPGLRVVAPILFAGILPLMVATGFGVLALVVRFFRARGVERQQLKVVAFTVVVTAVVGLVQANLQPVLAGTGLEVPNEFVGWVAFALLPVGVGVAVVRYRLYDVDRVISRTVAYALLAGVITALYAVIVALGGALLGGNGDRPAVVLAAAAAAALVFHPVRLRLQALANRLVFGRRASPYEVVTELSRRMANDVSFDEALPRLAEAAATGTGAVAGRAELTLGDRDERVAVWPAGEEARAFGDGIPIVHQGREIGRLRVALAEGQVLDPARARLLDDLASHAGVALRNVQLAAELELRLEQLRQSRQRIVAAGDAERKRVERDLHDGAQQRLVSAGLMLRLARSKASTGAATDVDVILEEVATELDQARRELRDLARGIYPAVLVDGGLAPAVRTIAERSPLPVEVRVTEARFAPALEATVYFVVAEALTNVVKHAAASAATVVVEADERTVVVTVSDDGRGSVDVSVGSGLRGLEDRVAALDGRLQVDALPGRGTTVRAELPCA
jgi:signal transduction histidine kinase